MIRILTICERVPPEGSGGSLATHLLLSGLVECEGPEKVELTILTSTRNPKRIKGVRYVFTPKLAGRNKVEALLNQYSILYHHKIVELVKKHDVIYIADHSYPFTFLAKTLRKPVIIHVHDFFPISSSSTILADSSVEDRSLVKLVVDRLSEALHYDILRGRSMLRGIVSSYTYPAQLSTTIPALILSDTLITVSRLQSNIITSHIPYVKNKVEIIYNPPPPIPPLGKPSSPKPSYLYLGGTSVVKGFPLIVKTIMEYKDRIHRRGYELVLIGVGVKNLSEWHRYSLDVPGRVLRIIKYLSSMKGVEVLGWISRDKVTNYFKRSWSLLFPSTVYEPLPYAVMESLLACRIPIATVRTGFTELLPRKLVDKYFLVKPAPKEIIDKMELIAAMTPSEVEDLGCRIREMLLSKIRYDEVVSKFLNIVVRLSGNAG